MTEITNYFQVLPPELKQEIANYLSDTDLLILIEAFDDYRIYNKSVINFEFDNENKDYRLNYRLLKNGLTKFNFNFESITELNLCGVFWISKLDIVSIIKKLKELKYINVIGTSLDFHAALSLNLHREDVSILSISDSKLDVMKNGPNYFISTLFEIKVGPIKGSPLHTYSIIQSGKLQATKRNKQYLNKNLNCLQKELRFWTYNNIVNDSVALAKHNPKRVYLENSMTPPDPDLLKNVLQLHFQQVTHLALELNPFVNTKFVNCVIKLCTNLKFLHLIDKFFQITPQELDNFCLLEDLRFESRSYMNIEKMFVIFKKMKEKKLKRFAVKFDDTSMFSYEILEAFLAANSQLQVFAMESDLVKKVQMTINKILKTYAKDPSKIFMIWKSNQTENILPKVPIIHYDIFGLEVKSIATASVHY